MDDQGLVKVAEEVVKEAVKEEPKSLKPQSVIIAYIFFAILGYSHTYSWQIVCMAIALFIGICAIRVIKWQLMRNETFDQYKGLFVETTLFAVEYYVLGWCVRWVVNYFG